MATNFPHSDSPAAPAMAAPAPPKESSKLDISNLMSPPDNLLETFNQGHGHQQSRTLSAVTASAAAMSANNDRLAFDKHPLPMSPPISPYTKHVSSSSATPSTPPAQTIQDPVLYPVDESSPSTQPPLFAPAEIEHHKRIVDNHVRARSSSTIIFSDVSPPRREDYELALTFRSQVMKHFTNNRRGWLLKERALLVADRQAGAQRFHAILPAKPIAAKPARSQRTDRVSKPQASAPRPIRSSVTGLPSSTVIVRPAPGRRPSATPEPSRRIVAPNREDKDFKSLPDYCPPLSSLPNRANSLKVDWKGQPIDLSNDPYHHLLHPDEIILAGNLRLDCATYLTSKRRMFERRLQCLRTGKEFRKTDAQQACKIDVNKASKLWTAFDKVGWLNAEWVRRFL
ncbi:swirm domain-containing [Trichoderma arundinaceum]|uniref:Swirm domain-containing n=1 Tax=Trichoderma arundinaceum TaxID=490622 RepID=A0A395NEZ2_TRIAR|nr:swirm domain-containing [Trichoderma arundinaceum]